MDFPALPNPFPNTSDLTDLMKNMTEIIKNMPIVNKPRQSTKPPKVKKLKFTIKKDFPALVESQPTRKKRIRKKSRNQGKLIKRFECDLINISEKIKEVCEKKSLVLRRTNDKGFTPIAHLRKKKLSRIKKAVKAAKEVVECQISIDNIGKTEPGINNSKINNKDKNVSGANIITSRIKKNFNNTNEVKRGFNADISIREYVDNVLDPSFDEKSLHLINRLTFAYMLKKAQTPLRAKKRVVSGFNEVLKALNFTQRQK